MLGIFFRNEELALLTKVVSENATVRDGRVLPVWVVALMIGWMATAEAGPAEDLLQGGKRWRCRCGADASRQRGRRQCQGQWRLHRADEGLRERSHKCGAGTSRQGGRRQCQGE